MQEAKSMICPLFIKLWYFWIFIFILIDYFLNNCFKIVIFGWSTRVLKTKKAFIKIHAFSSLCVCVLRSLSYVQLFVTLWTVVRQAPLSVEFSSQECQSGLPYFAPGDLSKPGIEPASLVSPELQGRFLTTGPPGKSPYFLTSKTKILNFRKSKVSCSDYLYVPFWIHWILWFKFV